METYLSVVPEMYLFKSRGRTSAPPLQVDNKLIIKWFVSTCRGGALVLPLDLNKYISGTTDR